MKDNKRRTYPQHKLLKLNSANEQIDNTNKQTTKKRHNLSQRAKD